MVCGKPLYFFKITALPLSFRCMYLQCKELCPALYCPLCSTQCFQTYYLVSFQPVIPQRFWILSESSTLYFKHISIQRKNLEFRYDFIGLSIHCVLGVMAKGGGIEDKKVSREPFWRQSLTLWTYHLWTTEIQQQWKTQTSYMYVTWIRTLLLSSDFFCKASLRYADKSFFLK